MEISDSIKSKLLKIAVEKHPGAICIANYKGGVGKTTLTTILGYYLAHKGYKVLLFDIEVAKLLNFPYSSKVAIRELKDSIIKFINSERVWLSISGTSKPNK